MSLCIIDIIKEHCPQLDPKIKWINDVILNHKKIAGILCESSLNGSTLDLVIGIGMNINGKIDSCLDDKAIKPTSLYE